jgi:putative ABC transport system permease protein
MLQRAPKAGKRIMLERIKPLWKRMSFTHKVTARNIFRYKKRFYMTVFGIAGCTALLVCAFGLRDSIHDIVDLQFGEIYNYNYTAYLKDGESLDTDPIITQTLSDEGGDDNVIELHSESGKIIASGGEHSATMLVPRDTERMQEFITMRERKTHNPIEFSENSVVIAEKLCETLGIKVGDEITLRNNDGKSANVTVTGICENYVTGFVYVSKDVFEKAFGAIDEYKVLWGKLSDVSEDGRSRFSGALLKSDNVLAISFSQTVRESFENTVKSIDYIVIVLIFAAGILAIIVLYNLTNINICERKKELATIKVLGFREGEVASYIYRETNILCLIGIAIGLVLGIWLHHFVVKTAEIDVIMFGRSIYAMSYVYAALVTVVFMALVELIMLKKLGGIDMVESMKANE